MSITIVEQSAKSDLIGIKPKLKKKVQIMRGVASMAVVWHHIGATGYLDPHFKLTGFFFPNGNIRPLLFFMLSGYLIGASVKHPPVDWSSIKKFLWKRIKRLYPLYFLAVLATFAITKDRDTLSSLLTHLVFLQGGDGGLVTENGPLWFMPFEIFFYVAFIPISFFHVKPLKVALASLAIGLTLLWAQIAVPLVISYCFGMVFWCTGLIVARTKWEEVMYPTSYLLALMLLLFCYQHVEAGQYVLNRLPFTSLPAVTDFIYHPVQLVYLQFLPLCVLIIAAFNNKKISWHRTFLWLVLLPPVGRLLYLAYSKQTDLPPALMESIALFFLSIALLIFPFHFRIRYLDKGFAFLGNISYSTYLIHAPIMFLFQRFEPFSGSAITAFLRLGLYLASTLTAAYVLEKAHKRFSRNGFPQYKEAGQPEFNAS